MVYASMRWQIAQRQFRVQESLDADWAMAILPGLHRVQGIWILARNDRKIR
jgi:hypothetical protein